MATTISQLVTLLSGMRCDIEKTEIEDTMPAAKEATRMSFDGTSSTSTVAVTAKKSKGKTRLLPDSDDEYERRKSI
jgi:hypothetical protein